MADVSKIKLPDNTEVNVKDSRISGVDTAPTSGSSNVVTSGGVYTAVQNAIGSVYRVKGTKATYAELPSSGNVTGDVWNVTAAYGNYPPGTNWVWTGSAWDALGGSVDLSGCQPLDADLTAIAGLSGTSGLLKKTAANTWSLDTNTYARVYSYNLAGASSVNITFAEGMYHAMIIARYTQTSEPLILIGAGYGDASVRNRFKQINTEEISIRWRYISGEGIQIVNTTSGQNARVSVLVTTGSGPTFTAATYDTTSAFEDYTLLKTSTAASKYLPLAGGTMTGPIQMTPTAESTTTSEGIDFGTAAHMASSNANSSPLFSIYSKGPLSFRPGTGSAYSSNYGLYINSSEVQICGETSGTPTLRFRRGTTSDAYVDLLIKNNAGKLSFVRSVSGTDTELSNFDTSGFYPQGTITNNVSSLSLGISTNQWASVYAKDATFSGNVAATGTVTGSNIPTYYSGTSDPSGSLGSNGDIYLKLSS